MTEAEWLTAREPKALLHATWGELTERKLGLIAIGCCRRLWHAHPAKRFRELIESVEKHVDGQIDTESITRELRSFHRNWWPPDNCPNVAESAAYLAFTRTTDQRELAVALNGLAAAVAWKKRPNAPMVSGQNDLLEVHYGGRSERHAPCPEDVNWRKARAAEQEAQASITRDVWNPFRPVAFSPTWRTDTAVALARQMYESREFGAMPILADALQDAGCEDEHILNHCRDANATHVRGCWVVDLVLGKE